MLTILNSKHIYSHYLNLIMKYYFSIRMTPEEFLPYYQGRAQTIIVTSHQGVRLNFPAMHLRSFLRSDGINGSFCLHTENNKFLSLTKVK